jgi:hypothetical protein
VRVRVRGLGRCALAPSCWSWLVAGGWWLVARGTGTRETRANTPASAPIQAAIAVVAASGKAMS